MLTWSSANLALPYGSPNAIWDSQCHTPSPCINQLTHAFVDPKLMCAE